MELDERRLSGEYIYKGRILNLRRDTVRLPDGREAKREVVEHLGGVGVLPLTDDGRIILVRQHRYPYGENILEIPAGKMDREGEDPLECGVRELREETGCTADSIVSLGCVYPSPGFLDEVVHIFLARGLKAGEARPDDGEFLKVEILPAAQVVDMIMSNEIRDAKTVAAVLKTVRLLGGELL